ncbi:molybdopterin-dependent oxidoreductase [Nostocoides vanveenii]|uniref:molybdopterin-dependent oxidoreductase n=1 Tax=Nostocoides vanveenii TaxID=330835 RepID=UPI0031E3C282
MTEATTQTRYITCVLCEASCGLEVTVDGEEVRGIRGHDADPLSRGHICPKAIALQDLHTDPDRLRTPVRRVGAPGADATWEPIAWEEAFDLVAERIVAIQAEHGNDAVAAYLGNPNVHSVGALTHGVNLVRTIKSRNTFSATSVDQLPHQLMAWALYGHQFLLPIPDIDRTDLLVLFGTNPMASNGSIMTVPDFPGRRRDLQARGGRLVVVDPRRTETAKVADDYLPIRPGSDAYVLLAMVRTILAEDLARPADYVDGIDAVREVVGPFTAERAAEASGIPADRITDLARAIAAAPSAALHARMGASTQAYGSVAQWAAQAINILTGNLDRPGGTMFTSPAIDMVGKKLIGGGHLGSWSTRVRGLPEFGSELPVSVLAEEITTPGDGQIRGLVCIAGNPVSSTPAGSALGDALAGLEFMVAIDFYVTESTRYADVILPPTGPLERDHYDLIFHTLAVRNTARWSPALFEKPEEARHDWEIARELALRIIALRAAAEAGSGIKGAATRVLQTVKDLPHVVEAQARFRTTPKQQVDLLLRTSGHRLSVGKLAATPGGVDLGPLEPRLPDRLATRDQRINLATPLVLDALPALLAAEPVARADELLLIGRRSQRDNNSWLHNLPRLTRGKARHQLLIHPDDAVCRGLTDGDRVTVASRVAQVEVECAVTDDMMPGVVSLPHGYGHDRPGVRLSEATQLPGVSINDLTDPERIESIGANAVLNGIPVLVSSIPGE